MREVPGLPAGPGDDERAWAALSAYCRVERPGSGIGLWPRLLIVGRRG